MSTRTEANWEVIYMYTQTEANWEVIYVNMQTEAHGEIVYINSEHKQTVKSFTCTRNTSRRYRLHITQTEADGGNRLHVQANTNRRGNHLHVHANTSYLFSQRLRALYKLVCLCSNQGFVCVFYDGWILMLAK